MRTSFQLSDSFIRNRSSTKLSQAAHLCGRKAQIGVLYSCISHLEIFSDQSDLKNVYRRHNISSWLGDKNLEPRYQAEGILDLCLDYSIIEYYRIFKHSLVLTVC